MSTTEQMMEKKLHVATRAAEIAMEAVKVLSELEKHVPENRRVLFNRSIKLPLMRKHQKAAGQVMFWQDREAVEQWMQRRTDYSQPALVYKDIEAVVHL